MIYYRQGGPDHGTSVRFVEAGTQQGRTGSYLQAVPEESGKGGDVVNIGDEVTVKVLEIDRIGSD